MSDTATAGIGHNQPDEFAKIKARAEALGTTANEWLRSVKEITDAETAQACDSFLAQVRAEMKASDADRKKINLPHDQAVKANNDRFRPLTSLLETFERLLSSLKAGWLKREQARIAAERAEAEAKALAALQAEEDAARAAAKADSVAAVVAADEARQKAKEAMATLAAAERARPQVKGELAARSSGLRQYWFAAITDWDKAIAHFSEDPRVREVVQALANAEARASHEKMAVAGAVAKMEERA